MRQGDEEGEGRVDDDALDLFGEESGRTENGGSEESLDRTAETPPQKVGGEDRQDAEQSRRETGDTVGQAEEPEERDLDPPVQRRLLEERAAVETRDGEVPGVIHRAPDGGDGRLVGAPQGV